MNHLLFAAAFIFVSGGCAQAHVQTQRETAMIQVKTDPDQTSTGIALDTEWKKKVFAYAQKNVVHPSWGIMHSERDYQITKKLAADSKITLDLDVLFAAAFLHDLGGIGQFQAEGVDHAVRSVQLVEPLLREWGFPMEK